MGRRHRRRIGIAVLLAMLWTLASPAAAEPLDLDRAERQREQAADRHVELQRELDALLSRIRELEVALEEQTARVEQLDAQIREERERAEAARARVAEHYSKAYTAGTGSDPLVSLLGGDDLGAVTERARLLSLLAADSQRDRETAESASARHAALSAQLEDVTADLAEQTDELEEHRREAERKVAEAEREIEELDRDIAAEKERRAEAARRRRAEERRRAREAAEASERAAAEAEQQEKESGGGSSGGAEVNGGIACPVGDPVSFSDTWGAARSGGRSHMGVDMLAPMGTPIYAYEDGVISRMSNNGLGGITLYLTGDSGNQYYYAHLSGYVSGISAGQRVKAGQHIAHNGDSGNAAGIPHLHFEVRPGGGSNVNPYPYAKRACG